MTYLSKKEKRLRQQQQTDDDNNDRPLFFERKIDEVTAGLRPEYSRLLYSLTVQNALFIADYILSMKTELNLSDNYREGVIKLLCKISKYHNNKKSFKTMTRNDIVSFLESYRKPEASDPLHRWIGTYNTYRMHLLRFFKWLYHPDVEPKKRPKPEAVDNIPQLKRKEHSIYKPTDLWTPEDDLLFLKYCPNKRDRCYHAISRDLSCRPHEILKLKIKDIFFKSVDSYYQYAEVLVNGKTGTRPIPLIDSIPYLKDYLDHEHPQPSNPNAPLICGAGKSLGRHIHARSLCKIYRDYKNKLFPKLLESLNVLPEDKRKIEQLLKKPWNPYIRRHSALTEKSTILKEHVLRQHAGWSARSQMHLKYLHYFGNESSESLLEAYGIVTKDQQTSDSLKPKQCPNCSEPNKPDSKFCAKCRMVLTYDAYNETVEEKQQEKEKQIEVLIKKQEQFEQLIQSLIDSGQLKPIIKN
jgi:integrase/recombinase XerD